MDGTIINEQGLLNPNDKVMLEKFRENGNLFAFNTGRNIKEAKAVVNRFGLSYDYLVLNNGAQIVDRNNNVLFKRIISKEVGIDIIKHCLKYDNLWLFYFDGTIMLATHRGDTYEYVEGEYVLTKEYDFQKEYLNVKEFDIIAINQDDQQINNVLKIQSYIKDNYIDEAHGTLNTHFLDITPSSCSKGTGVSCLVDLLEGEFVTYAIGDSYNDISMFAHADYGYTFNRVSDEIKAHSDRQVDYLSDLIEEIIGGN